MYVGHLHMFLIEVQKENNATLEDAQAIIDGLGRLHELRHLNIFSRKCITIEAFFKYLFSDANHPLPPPRVMLTPFVVFWLYGIPITFLVLTSKNNIKKEREDNTNEFDGFCGLLCLFLERKEEMDLALSLVYLFQFTNLTLVESLPLRNLSPVVMGI